MSLRRQKLPAGMYSSHSELCERFSETARASGYRVFPIVGTWDVVIECRESGTQVGVQAALRPGLATLWQAVAIDNHIAGPAVHAVLVPVPNRPLLQLSRMLGVLVLQGVTLDRFDLRDVIAKAPRWNHTDRQWTPEHEAAPTAVIPTPRRSSPWKVSAVKLCLMERSRGYVTLADMKRLNLDPAWWFAKEKPYLEQRMRANTSGVLEPVRGQYVLADPSSPLMPDFLFPHIAAKLESEVQEAEAQLRLAELDPVAELAERPLPAPPRMPTDVDDRPRGPRPRVRVGHSEVRTKGGAAVDERQLSSPFLMPPANTSEATAEGDRTTRRKNLRR